MNKSTLALGLDPHLLLIVTLSFWILEFGRVTAADLETAHLTITEFCASNLNTIADEDGDYPDWIELENLSDSRIDIRRYYLTDDPRTPNKFRLPSFTLAPGDRVIIFASGKTKERSRPPFHAPFKLANDGEYLALVERDSGSIIQEFSPAFPKQIPGFSYGRPWPTQSINTEANATFEILESPTPGSQNTAKKTLVKRPSPNFSPERGFYQKTIQLALSAKRENATILYTTNGSPPTKETAKQYTDPIQISKPTIVRAIAIYDGQASAIVTHSYLFPSQVSQQKQPAGFPEKWANIPADYEMDPQITKNPNYKNHLVPALHSLPSLSISTDQALLFGKERGIYANPNEHGIEWERPISMEWINDDQNYQINAGLRIQGGWFRNPTVTRKHSFRIRFRRTYGKTKLKFDIFNEFGSAKEFESLILRAGGNDGYSWADSKGSEQFIRDEFGRRTALAMGQAAPRGRFVHLYLNGCYWGLYNLCERPDQHFSESYHGGSSMNWDALNTGVAKAGSTEAWRNTSTRIGRVRDLPSYFTIQGFDSSGARDYGLPQFFNIKHYIDYLLVNMWVGNADWPDKNYWQGWYRGAPSKGFQFYPWDMEISMGNNRLRSPLNFEAPYVEAMRSGATEAHYTLRGVREYQSDFSDRVQKHFFSQGALSLSAMRERYKQWADQVQAAVILESARWGDDQFETPQELSEWMKERDWLIETYIPQRGSIVLEQLRRANLYSRIPPPTVYPIDGDLENDELFRIASIEDEVYFTLDGTDPRLRGGKLSPTAKKLDFDFAIPVMQEYTLVAPKSIWQYASDLGQSPFNEINWRPESLDSAIKWKVGFSPLGVGRKDIQTTIKRTLPKKEKTVNPPQVLKKQFSIPRPLPIDSLTLWIQSSDAASVFLNGKSLYRSNLLPYRGTTSPYSQATSELNEATELTIPANDFLRMGKNELIVFIHQRDQSDTTTMVDISLMGTTTPSAGTLNLTTMTPGEFGTLKIRARKGEKWSPLTERDYTRGIPRPKPGDIKLTTIAFNPSPAATPVEKRVARNSSDFEYVTIANSSPGQLNLSGLRISDGVEFEFPRVTILAPQESVTIARDRIAFQARNGDAIKVMGNFKGKLDNKGDRLHITSSQGATIESVTYQTQTPWPVATEDTGSILIRTNLSKSSKGNDFKSWELRSDSKKKQP